MTLNELIELAKNNNFDFDSEIVLSGEYYVRARFIDTEVRKMKMGDIGATFDETKVDGWENVEKDVIVLF